MSYSLRIDNTSSETLFSMRNDGVVSSDILLRIKLRRLKRNNKINRIYGIES